MQIDRINGLVGNQGMKTPVLCIATGAILLSGEQTIDGVVCLQPSSTNSNRVLVTGQADATTNGIYLCQASAWTREPDWDGSLDVRNGTLIPVATGTQYAGTLWRVTTADIIAVGTSNITFSQVFTSTATPILNAPNKNPPIGADKISIVDSVTGLLALLTFTNLVTYLSGLCSAGWNAFTSSSCSGNAFTSSSCSGNSATATALVGIGDSAAFESRYGAAQFSIAATVAASALTGTLNPCKLDFRNATLSNGAPVNVSLAAALSMVVPSGATLGTVGGVYAQLVWLVAYNGGVPVLCVVNLAGGVNLDETTLISPTTGASSAANVIYSASDVAANSPFRVVGFCGILEAAAGTWATVPTTVQGIGGQALAALSSLGYGQTWQAVSRAIGTIYYNTTGKPIAVAFTGYAAGAITFAMTINGVPVTFGAAPAAVNGSSTIVIPAKASYALSGPTTLTAWDELK